MTTHRGTAALVVFCLSGIPVAATEPATLQLLFLGDKGHHAPKSRFDQLEPVMAKRGITLAYTGSLDSLSLDNLKKYDGLVIYANHERGKPEHVKAIRDYVA